MKFILLCLILTSLYSIQTHAIVVVVSKDSNINSLTKRQVVDIYMGRFNTFPNGENVSPFDLPPQSTLKNQFYMQLLQKSEKKVNSYWARLLFSGSAKPPTIVKSVDDIISRIIENNEMMAYIPESEVRQGVKVVFKFVQN